MKVIECISVPHTINNNITFIRIDPGDLQNTLAQIIEALVDLSWLSRFDEDYLVDSFQKRATETINDIKKKFANSSNDKATKEAGEYIVSELARQSLVTQMNYLHIPLSELLGVKVSGNPGFDFHSQNNATDTIIFGEAKFNSQQSAHGKAIEQAAQFIKVGKDIKQLVDLQHFCTSKALNRANNGFKGFAIAFSAKPTASKKLIDNVLKHKDFINILPFEEIVVVAVNL